MKNKFDNVSSYQKENFTMCQKIILMKVILGTIALNTVE